MTVREALSQVRRDSFCGRCAAGGRNRRRLIAERCGAAIEIGSSGRLRRSLRSRERPRVPGQACRPAATAGPERRRTRARRNRHIAAARAGRFRTTVVTAAVTCSTGRRATCSTRASTSRSRQLEAGTTITPSFRWNRSTYDIFLTQEARVQHGLDPETYVRELARWGFTHAEVNALAYPMGIETGPKGEVYPMFYTYCPAMDQFVYSSLNKGLYPFYYLSANLAVSSATRRSPASTGWCRACCASSRGTCPRSSSPVTRCCAGRASITRSGRSGRVTR